MHLLADGLAAEFGHTPADGDFGLDRPWAEGPLLLWEQSFMSCACEDAETIQPSSHLDAEDVVE